VEIKDFDELIKLLKCDVALHTPGLPQFIEETKNDFMEILNSDFKHTSDCFKKEIVVFFNSSYEILPNDLSRYKIFRIALYTHLDINYQYKFLKMPFGYKDQDKYQKKINAWIEKYKKGKIKGLVQPVLSPYKALKFFAIKIEEGLYLDNVGFSTENTREKKQQRKELILELTKIILCDCTIYRRQLRNAFRITPDNKEQYKFHTDKFADATKNKSEKIFYPKA